MRVKIYTDGGCSGNPGPGGWAYIIVAPTGDRAENGAGDEKASIFTEKWGSERNTTNNRMELSAAVAALEALLLLGTTPELVIIYTDSQYMQKGMKTWIHSWKRNGWRTSAKDPVKNKDLWQRLDELTGRFPVRWEWVKGHAGNELNERCDRMTQEAIASIRGTEL